MIIMPSNNTSFVTGFLAASSPEKFAFLISPDGWRIPKFKTKYALDNGCFKRWEKDKFFLMLRKASLIHKPLWVCVPDAVADKKTTMERWAKYHKRISGMGFKLCFVAQDGMVPGDVPKEAYACFIGGSKEWKRANAHKFHGVTDWLHVGRVNNLDTAKYYFSIGALSVDGTGWLLAKDKKYNDLIEYFLGKDQMQWI